MRLLLLLSFVLSLCDSYKILVVSPIFGHSHSNFMGKLADALTEKGHNVTVIMPVVNHQEMRRTGVKLTKNVMVLPPHPDVIEMMETAGNVIRKQLWSMDPSPFALLRMSTNMSESFSKACETVVSNRTLMEYLRNEKFDIGLGEPFTFCPFGIFEALDLPVTLGSLSVVSKELISSYIGEPSFPSFVPAGMGQYGNEMTFFQRFANLLGMFAGEYFFKRTFDGELAIFKKYYGDQFRHYSEVFADSTFMFTNSNPYLSFTRPIIPKTVEIGGIVIDEDFKSPKNLGDYDKILNERKYTVLVSFGSVAKSKDMPEENKETLLSVFEEMKDVTFIWKYEEDSTMADHLPNVHLAKWMPQVALLNDPRLNLFVTHGGLGSTTEVAYLGKPAVFIPLFADQVRNSIMLSRYNGSVLLTKNDLKSKDVILETFKKVLYNEEYAKNAEKLSEILVNSPNNPKETFLKHVEFAGKTGRIPNLDSYARRMSFIQFFNLDVIFSVILVLSLSLAIIYYIIRKVISKLRNKKTKRE